jgi:hypothetical protein
VTVDGEPRHFISAKFPLHDDRGTVTAVCGISTDITPLKRAETERERRSGSGRERLLRLSQRARVAALHHVPQPRPAQLRLEEPVRRVGRDAVVADEPDVGLGGGVELGEEAVPERVQLTRVLLRTAEPGEVLFDDSLHQ